MMEEGKITESKKRGGKEAKKLSIMDFQLPESGIRRLKSLIEWERQSAESNKSWILGEPSSYYR